MFLQQLRQVWMDKMIKGKVITKEERYIITSD